jgi:hypothetical protein
MLRSLAEHVPSARIDALDMVEEGDKVALAFLRCTECALEGLANFQK